MVIQYVPRGETKAVLVRCPAAFTQVFIEHIDDYVIHGGPPEIAALDDAPPPSYSTVSPVREARTTTTSASPAENGDSALPPPTYSMANRTARQAPVTSTRTTVPVPVPTGVNPDDAALALAIARSLAVKDDPRNYDLSLPASAVHRPQRRLSDQPYVDSLTPIESGIFDASATTTSTAAEKLSTPPFHSVCNRATKKGPTAKHTDSSFLPPTYSTANRALTTMAGTSLPPPNYTVADPVSSSAPPPPPPPTYSVANRVRPSYGGGAAPVPVPALAPSVPFMDAVDAAMCFCDGLSSGSDTASPNSKHSRDRASTVAAEGEAPPRASERSSLEVRVDGSERPTALRTTATAAAASREPPPPTYSMAARRSDKVEEMEVPKGAAAAPADPPRAYTYVPM